MFLAELKIKINKGSVQHKAERKLLKKINRKILRQIKRK